MQNRDYEQFIMLLREYYLRCGTVPKAMVVTYGCQQNMSDSEILKGELSEIGFEFCDSYENADVVIFNSCAVREHAELKLYGNVGALKQIKAKRPDMKIAVCGCMVQQESVQNEIKSKYRYVDMVFGPSLIYKFPEMLYHCVIDGQKTFDRSETPEIFENLPVKRSDNNKAWVTVMYGCNNFCTYCIVPYLRGRERSRKHEYIIEEVKSLVNSGYKDITLLGQNVNSYGKDLYDEYDFSDLLQDLNKIEGDFWLRFVTSHPKDCSHKLIDTMAACEKVCNQLHLPFQSGSDRVLEAMNRHYTSEQYADLIEYARKKMPDIAITSDVIVGFPGETYNEFLDTVKLIKKIQPDNLFTFIFSKRSGTPAAVMDEQISNAEKTKRFNELLEAFHPIVKEKNDLLFGKKLKVFVESISKSDPDALTCKTEGGKTVIIQGDKSIIGTFVNVEIVETKTWYLKGKVLNGELV